ncbi:uncharacterized protein [Triticum aestivum]|uniref:uncharacterized protein n=1 Tax=Triticum aestivum TaxID=4565 RepID=UPI001D0301D7|nr:uncharacterized protein LOC123042452 [Triticum aestivum]
MEFLKIAPLPSSAYAGSRRTSSSADAPGRAAHLRPVLRVGPAADTGPAGAHLACPRRLAVSAARTHSLSPLPALPRPIAWEYAAAARLPASAAYGGGLRAFAGFPERGLASLCRPVVAATPTGLLARVPVLLGPMAPEHSSAADARGGLRLPRGRLLIRCTQPAEGDVGVSVTEQEAPVAKLQKLVASLNWKIRLAAALGCMVLAGRVVIVVFENLELTVPKKLARAAAIGFLVLKTLHSTIKDTKEFSELVLYFIKLYMEDVKKKGT